MPIVSIDSSCSGQRCCQQQLHYCFPHLHPITLLSSFGTLALFLVVISAYFIYQSSHLLEQQLRFVADTEQSQKIVFNKVIRDKRIYLYYKLPKYYQNVRTYVQGIDYSELA